MQGPYKVEIIQLLQEFYDPSRPAWSLDELKQILKENMFPEAEAAIEEKMRGLHFTRRAQLPAEATEGSAHTMPGAPTPLLKMSALEVILQKREPEPTIHMGFGKHGTMTYQQVLGQHPSYAVWCETEMNPGNNWKLVRCVSCINEPETAKPRQEMARDPREVPTEPPEARGGARSSRQEAKEAMMEDVYQEMEKREAATQEVLYWPR